MKEDDIKQCAIEAITNKIIEAKIDQKSKEIVIKFHKLR